MGEQVRCLTFLRLDLGYSFIHISYSISVLSIPVTDRNSISILLCSVLFCSVGIGRSDMIRLELDLGLALELFLELLLASMAGTLYLHKCLTTGKKKKKKKKKKR